MCCLKSYLSALGGLAVALSAAWACPQAQGIGETVNRRDVPAVVGEESPAPDSVEARLAKLTLEQRVAQLFFVSLGGTYRPNDEDRTLFGRTPPGGVIVPAATQAGAAADYVNGLRNLPAEAEGALPFFIGTNSYSLTQHGLLPTPAFGQLPSLLAVAAAQDPEATKALGQLIGRQMAAMGFNVHIGPPLELAAEIDGAVGTVHTFGGEPALAARAAGTLVEALKAENLLVMPTGFPGGAANRGEAGPAVLLTPHNRLLEEDLKPFRAAIEQDLPLLHVGNTLVPTIDKSGLPASMSPTTIRDLLRRQLGYKGLVVAGPVDSPDLTRRYKVGQAAVAAFLAGADMIWLASGSGRAMRTVVDVSEAVRSGSLKEELINAAVQRVWAAKEAAGLADRARVEKKDAEKVVEEARKSDAAYRIERQSITLLQNRGGILPVGTSSTPIGVTGVMGVEELYEPLKEELKQVVMQPIATARHATRVHDFEIDRLTRNLKGLKIAVCVFSDEVKPPGQVQLIRALKEKNARVVVIYLGHPKDVGYFQEADAILLAYPGAGSMTETMKSVADVLMGQAPVNVLSGERDLQRKAGESITFNAADVLRSPQGRLPIDLAPMFPLGHAISYDARNQIKKIEWDFGDGAKSKDLSTQHAYKAPGRYTINLTVTDKRGRTSDGTFHVTVE